MSARFDFVVPDFDGLWRPKIVIGPYRYGYAECRLTPELAQWCINHMVDNQRNPRSSLSDRYASDIANDKWITNHQGVAWNYQGEFFDGQNRCYGVIDAGKPIDTVATFGVGGAREMAVTDTGGPRTPLDAAHVMGIQVDNNAIATVRMYLNQNREKAGTRLPLSNTQLLDASKRWRKELALVGQWFSSPKIRGTDRAPIRAAVLAAVLWGADSDKLARFVAVLCDKVTAADDVADSAAVVLRQHIINKPPRNGGACQVDLFLRTCNSLSHGLAGEYVKKSAFSTVNPFIKAHNGLFKN